jgi:hypothetical protein
MENIMADNKVPFDMPYVMKTTFRHMIKSIDISLDKTVGRIEEFDSDSEKSTEILQTISYLSLVRKSLVEYQRANPNQFKGHQDND